VILAAAKVGGIKANMRDPVGFLVDNLEIQNNVMLASAETGAKKLMFLGSSCIYPRNCDQPISESAFMSGPLEPTNESYAVAKIAGIRLLQSLASKHHVLPLLPMPCNIYGPGDSFDLENSHVLSALVRKFVVAKRENLNFVEVWGTGRARREFLHSDDLAEACMHLLESDQNLGLLNVGSGKDYSILELAEMISRIVKYDGDIRLNLKMPDGMLQKLLDCERISQLGWKPSITLESGVQQMIGLFEAQLSNSLSTVV
jgi:GDP-L-fucose synthase